MSDRDRKRFSLTVRGKKDTDYSTTSGTPNSPATKLKSLFGKQKKVTDDSNCSLFAIMPHVWAFPVVERFFFFFSLFSRVFVSRERKMSQSLAVEGLWSPRSLWVLERRT